MVKWILATVMAMASCWSFADFDVTQCDVIQLPNQMSDMESIFTTSSLWNGLPVTGSYHTIAFANNPDTDIIFPMNSFPGKTDRFAVKVTGRILILEKGLWTFSVCHDAGFICTIVGNGYSDSFMEKEWSPIRDVKTFDIPIAGIYTVKIIHWNGGGAAMLEFAVAKGYHSEFNSSLFHLVGDSSSGIACVDPIALFAVYEANGGTGTMEPQTFEDGKKQKLSKNLFKKDGYVFKGWAKTVERANAETVDYKDEAEIAVDADMTLYAVWTSPALTLTAESADWSSGSITLRCEDPDTSGAAHEYTLEYKNASGIWEEVDDAKNKLASKGQDANGQEVWIAKLTDNTFWTRLGGLPPVEYRVKDENGRESEGCVTRKRYGLFVGVGHYSSAYQSILRMRGFQALEDLNEVEINTRNYMSLAEVDGKFDIRPLLETDATVKNLDDAFPALAEDVVPGDICFFYASTHGWFDKKGNAGLAMYDGDYSDLNLKDGIGLLSAKDVAVICIFSACKSEALLRQSSANVAVIAAANYLGYSSALFDEILMDYGWRDGWAAKSEALTFRDLADYAKTRYNEIFNGITFAEDGITYTWTVASDNDDLMGRITAGVGKYFSHDIIVEPNMPSNVTASTNYRDKIEVKWEGDSDADRYYVFFGEWGSGVYEDFKGTRSTTYDFSADKYECVKTSSNRKPVSFVVRAFNGAGMSSSTNFLGWVDTKRRVKFDAKGGTPSSWRGEYPSPLGIVIANLEIGTILGDLPTATKEGFTFVYWYMSRDDHELCEIATPNTIVTSDITYSAWWTDMPQEYIDSHQTIATASGGDIATAARMTAANGCRTVGECYALGIDPEDPNDDLKIAEFKMKDGKPEITLNHTKDGSGNSFEDRVKILGKAELSDAEWQEVSPEGNPAHRFFKVGVEMP